MSDRERFVEIFRSTIKREGSDKLLEWLCSPYCDFFTAPASTRFHGSVPGGLCAHSLNVYDCLCDYMKHTDLGKSMRDREGNPYTEENLAIAALLHDLCKVNFYKETTRNVKKNGVWETVPYYSIEDNADIRDAFDSFKSRLFQLPASKPKSSFRFRGQKQCI